MSIAGVATVCCPACGKEQDVRLVQSINARTESELKLQLLRGELDVLACTCGKRTQLAATMVFHDPDADYYAQVVPGDDAAIARAVDAFVAASALGTQRIVPSMNALIEKVKILDAKLEDWAIEMIKVLLLASTGVADLDRVLLFDSVDGAVIRWVLFDEHGRDPNIVSSPLPAYEKLAAREHSRPAASEYRIDRAWATRAVEAMIASIN